jgi:hypothetical protein
VVQHHLAQLAVDDEGVQTVVYRIEVELETHEEKINLIDELKGRGFKCKEIRL